MRAILLVLYLGVAAAADRLPGLSVDAAGVTVSGVSSGGYMAVQMHVAHSSRVKGAGVLAGGPYYCAQGGLWTAYYNCMTPSAWTPLPSVDVLKSHADLFAGNGSIDATSHLAAARVWLFSGTRDHTVKPAVTEALGKFYALYKAPFVLVKDRPAGHAMVTEDSGSDCGVTRAPYINDCDYDAAGELLKHLLGNLSPPAARPAGQIVSFDQKEFADGDARAISMADTGYAYVPAACAGAKCRLHVAFHGCRQSAQTVGERFIREAGYNRWADTNRLIVLYPQTIARYWRLWNPRGCWDWWGYTDQNYATKTGPQLAAVWRMVERLAE
jgi:poly(3-hydroxybutyrate) depolymerase